MRMFLFISIFSLKGKHSYILILALLSHISTALHICFSESGSALLKIMACRLFGAKPSSYYKQCWVIVSQLETSRNKPQGNFARNARLNSRKCIWKYRLRNGGHFAQGVMSEMTPVLLPEASFGLRVLSLPASVCVCVCVCGNHLLVRTITCHPFKLESPNLDQKSKTPWLRSLLFWGLIDLELQGQI